jgi:hypothetical protein
LTQVQLQPRSRTPKSPSLPREEGAVLNELTPKKVERDANVELGLFEHRGTQAAHTMEDLTQKSSMSLTQENPTSAYEQYGIQTSIRDQFPSNASADDTTDPDEGPTQIAIERDSHVKHASTKTESTAFTYEENDPGHIKLVFNPEPVDMEMDESQDTSYAVPQMEPQLYGQYYEPQTPAPAVNPFTQKGSVLKGAEMFGATQPSSIGRHMASPSSSRPSPDIYNDFTSPPQRKRMLSLSSPLVRNPQDEDISPLPLQSSVRNLLARTVEGDSPQISAPRTPGVRSFDPGPRIHQAQLNEPRPYVSMKESQERRQQTLDSDSDGSDSDIEAVPRKRRKQREEQIKKELSAVVRMPSSSRPKSSSPAMVEVPSTGRRRSVQADDYIAQRDGFDARDTQQDDFIADSQAVPERACSEATETSQAEPDPESSPAKTTQGEPSQPLGSSDPPVNSTTELPHLDYNTTREQPESMAEGGTTLQELSLPLQEVSTNRNDIRTPTASKNEIFSDEADSTVPETSPAEDRLRPMREIASISFGANEDLVGYVPGFTQDVDFDHAMGLSSPAPPPRDNPRLPPPPSTLPSTMPSADLSKQAEDKSEKGDGDSLALKPNIPTNGISEVVTEQGVDKDRHGAPNQPAIIENATIHRTSGNIVLENGENGLPPASPGVEPEALAVQQAEENAGGETNLDGQQTTSDPEPPSTKRSGLRSKNELKGPSRSLRRSGETSAPSSATPRQTTRITKSSASKLSAVRSSDRLLTLASTNPRSTPQRQDSIRGGHATASATRSSTRKSVGDAVPDKAISPASAPPKRTSKRSSGVVVVDEGEETPVATRSSKRKPTVTREDSADRLTLPIPSAHSGGRAKKSAVLFTKMAFAVSYVNHEQDRDKVTKLILDNGGRILQDGFDSLFDVAEADLALSSTANALGFTALIADEHSRKAKYMQALALGLPCISGHWITACVTKTTIVDWSPYLLSAGQSSHLGAHMSRSLQPYPADDATLLDTFAARQKLLGGKSVLLVAGRSEKRKPYVFLTRVLGPGRFEQVPDNVAARKKLAESQAEGQQWDILYVEGNIDNAEAVVFGSATTSSGSSKKRKRGPAAAEEEPEPVPKKIRMINDETMIQSLIVGHLLEE